MHYCIYYLFLSIHFDCAVVIDSYPNTSTVEQGTTLTLVCRVVGVPSTTVLRYQWTCPGGYCDAGAVDPEWAARIQQGNILVVNVRNSSDNGAYTCTVMNSTRVGTSTYTLSVASELVDTGTIWHATMRIFYEKITQRRWSTTLRDYARRCV